MDYDILILGAGPGGYVAGIRAAQLGAKVGIIEERELGGVCLNRGCIPTKALIESAHSYSTTKRGAEFGFTCGESKPDFARVMKRKEEVSDRLRKGIEALMKKNKIDVIRGRGKLLDKHTIEVAADGAARKVTGENLILATGSEPLRLPGFPFDGRTVLTSDDALKLDKLPASMLIVGGGYIGVEWASIFEQFGCQVTIVEMMDQLLPRSDTDLAKELFRLFKKKKMDIFLGTKVDGVEVNAAGAKCKLSNGQELQVEKVLVSIGRAINSKGVGLEEVGVKTERGAVVIDEQCRTSVPNIYAIGDVTAKLMLAHVATRQGIVAVESIMGHHAKMDYRVIPACVFTEFEIASVGKSNVECKAAGLEVKEAKFPFMALGKAQATGETYGWAKIIADAKSGEVIGVHIIGSHASALISEAALAMSLEATVESIANTIHAHPTLPEAISECAEAWLGKAIHV